MDEQRPELAPREAMEFDVVVVGAGPAGLAAAIRLKQLATAAGKEVSVVVLEKGSEVGAHILSGAVIDPNGLNALIPDWQAKGAPLDDAGHRGPLPYLWPAGALRLPNFLMPPLMSNHGNYIVSLGQLVRWLGEQATELGVEIYPGFAAAEVLYDEDGAVAGVATGDMGVGRDGKPKETSCAAWSCAASTRSFAEGARGSLAKQLIEHVQARRDGREPQKYGIGIKELWEVAPDKHQPGLVQHIVRLAARQSHRRRLVPLPLRRQPGVGRLRAAPQLREPLPRRRSRSSSASRRIPRSATFRGRQAHRLRRARDHRGRLAIDAEARVSGRRAARLRGRLHERAAHQGQPQRHAVRHRGG